MRAPIWNALPWLLFAACGGDNGPAVPDSGVTSDGGCRPRTKPVATSWPFPRSTVAYRREFYDVLPGRNQCSTVLCHGGTLYAPSVPVDPNSLDEPATLERALSDLWSRAVPTAQEAPPSPAPRLTWFHRPGGANPPEFSASQLTFLRAFVERGQLCAYGPLIEAERMNGPNCTNGLCDCPLPDLDLSYCGP